MAQIPLLDDLSALKGKTIIVTGGAQGIGAGLVELATASGMNVVFGDLDAEKGNNVAAKTGAVFLKTDVTVYADQLALFKEALARFGSVDHAVANAGIYEPTGLYEASIDLESVQQEPSIPVVDINLKSVVLFTHIASVFLRQKPSATGSKSITILSSASGLMCPSQTPIYNSTKAGLLGLVRSLAQSLPASHGISVNAVCPSMTVTRLVDGDLYPKWQKLGLPVNQPIDIGRAILTLSTARHNRKVLWVEGGRGWDTEAPLMDFIPQWIGDGPWETLQSVMKEPDLLSFSQGER